MTKVNTATKKPQKHDIISYLKGEDIVFELYG